MKKFLAALLSFMLFVLISAPLVSMAADSMGIHPATVLAGVVVSLIVGKLLLPSVSNINVVRSGVQVEVWVNYLIERFWKDNAFLKNVYRDDQYVLAGKVVHIPQIGAKPVVVKNRSSFPAVAVGRTDTDVTYSLDVYTTDPTHIQDAEKHELSYDKINSVLGDHAGAMNETIADDTIIKWLTGIGATSKLATTGAAVGATAAGATGNRKLLTAADIRQAMTKFNADNVPSANRFIMPSANMLDHLIQSLSETQYRDFSNYMDAKTGIIGKLFGFTFVDRSSVAVADSSNVVKALGAAGETGDSEITLVWQKDAVAAALGEIQFYDDVNNPLYYGDIYSSLMRAGGRRRRSDDKGIIQLVQGV